MKVELSKDQCISLADFISLNLLDVIRNDVDIDNLNYVRNLLNALQTFEEAAKNEIT
jgi:hypothetical protein